MAINDLLCMKNAGAQIAMDFSKNEGLASMANEIRDHPFKTSACLRGGGVSPWADGQKVAVPKYQKSPS